MTTSKLIDVLRELGCHTTDITDALYEADQSWLNRLKDHGWYEDCAEDESTA
jgi:hypothetical protein